MRGVSLVLASAAAAATVASSAWAQPAGEAPARTSEELAREAGELAKAGRHVDALPLFVELARRDPSAEHHCLVALSYFRLDRVAEAHLRLARASRAGDERPRWCDDQSLGADVQRALEAGAYALAEITVEPSGAAVRAGSFLEEEALTAPATVWLAFGTQRLTVSHEGYVAKQVDVDVQGKSTVTVRVTLDASAAAPASDQLAATPATKPAPGRGRGDGRRRGGSARTWGWISLAAGGAALATGAAFHWRAMASKRDAEQLLPGATFDEELSRFRTQRMVTLALYGTAAIATGVGLYLLSRPREREREPVTPRLDAWLAPGTVFVSVSGSL